MCANASPARAPSRSAIRRRNMRYYSKRTSRAGRKSSRPPAFARTEKKMRITAPVVLICSLCGGSATAADYPEKPIRLIVGFSAGGSADIGARTVSKKLGETLGTTMVIDNRGGAGGSVAAQLVAAARPDGYTLLWGSVGALTINQILEKICRTTRKRRSRRSA